MVDKKFLIRQDENIEEYGIQVNDTTPVSSVTNQSYIDKSTSQIKLYANSKNYVLSERARTKQQSLISNNISFKNSEVFVASINSLTSTSPYYVSTVFDGLLYQQLSYTKTGNTLSTSFWIKTQDFKSKNNNIFFYPKETPSDSFGITLIRNKIQLTKKNTQLSYVLPQNTWAHIVAMYDDIAGIVLYLNGTQVASAAADGSLASTGTVIIGSKNEADLLKNNSAYGWGNNPQGQLGDNTTVSKSSPVQVVGQSDFVAIATGGNHSLGLKSDGRIFSWGRNSEGQLGDGTYINKSSPVQVINESDFVAIAAASYHSLALKADGRVLSWGDNTSGQLGDNSLVGKQIPTLVVNESNFVAIASGDNGNTVACCSLALKADGRIFSWGANAAGQLGDNTIVAKSVPTLVVGQSDFVAIAINGRSTVGVSSLALKADGRVFSWGSNTNGQLGDNTIVDKSSPVQVVGQSDFVAIASGYGFFLALKADGRVFSWGYNASGQLGDNTTVSKSSPVQVVGQSDFVAIAAAAECSVALKADGTVWAWGNNANGSLGDNTTINKSSPVQVVGQSDFVAVSGGNNTTFLALKGNNNFKGRISNIEFWSKDLAIDAFILYKMGYSQSTSSITYPTGLINQYLMGDGKIYDLNISSADLENKTANILINNTDYSPAIVNFLIDGLNQKISNSTPTEDNTLNYIKNNGSRIAEISSIQGILFTNYKDSNLTGSYVFKDEKDSVNATLNKRPTYITDIPSAPVLKLSTIFDNTNYYTVNTSTAPVPSSTLSVSCWIKMNPSDTTQQIFKYGNFELYLNGTTLTLKKGTSIVGTSTFDLSIPGANQGWNHFVATWYYAGAGTGTIYTYINGIQAIGSTGLNDVGGFATIPSGTLYIGGNNTDVNYRLYGKMSHFELWHGNLTQADASTLYTAKYYTNPASLVAKTLALWYTMGDYKFDNYLTINSLSSNTIPALATGVLLFDKIDIPS